MKISICKGQLLGTCPKCQFDVDKQHHPNNLDCPNYKFIGCVYIDMLNDKPKKEENEGDESSSQKAS